MYNTIYPNYLRPYSGIRNGQIYKKTDDEKNSQSSQQAENNSQQASQGKKNAHGDTFFPNGEKVAIDYTKRQINIEQVLKDFRNTANAIGTPDDIKKEVEQYLELIEGQAQKPLPNSQVIQSNLRNASQILDEYITNTLKKPSKVVENWVDALFLQQIDYKLPVKETEEVVEEEKPEEIKAEEPVEEAAPPQQEETQQNSLIPKDETLKKLFLQAKKYSSVNNREKALVAFQNAMDYAKEIGDEQTCAMIHFEKGKIYDETDNIEQALFNFNQAAIGSKDNNIKAKSYMSMGKIYDDFVKFEPAVNNYCAAVSYAGEADNLPLQTKVLSDLAQLHAHRYDSNNSLLFMDLSDTIANETKNNKIKGIISRRNGMSCEILNESGKALKYFGKSASAFSQTEDKENLAKDYQAAAEIMLKYGNKAKAKSLLSKAFVAAQSTENFQLKQEITSKLSNL